MNKAYAKLAGLPTESLTLKFGKFKGKKAINPQSCIEAVTEEFGLCGEGWKYEVVSEEVKTFDDKQMAVYMKVAFYVKTDANKWSAPVFGYGGEFVRKQYKNDFVINDDAFKTCLLDALCHAMRFVGVGAKTYKEDFSCEKYTLREKEVLATVNVLFDENKCYVRLSNGLKDITELDTEKLKKIMGIDIYSRAKDAIEKLIKEREAKANG